MKEEEKIYITENEILLVQQIKKEKEKNKVLLTILIFVIIVGGIINCMLLSYMDAVYHIYLS